MCLHPQWEDSVKLTNVAEMLAEITVEEAKQCQKVPVLKDWTTEQWYKVLWTDDSKFEFFGSNKWVYVGCRVGQRAAIPCITPTAKTRFGYVGGDVNCKVGDLFPLKEKLNKSSYHSILQHHLVPSGTRLIAQRFVLIQHVL